MHELSTSSRYPILRVLLVVDEAELGDNYVKDYDLELEVTEEDMLFHELTPSAKEQRAIEEKEEQDGEEEHPE